MALGDRLEASLAATRRGLLDALSAEALAPAERELEAADRQCSGLLAAYRLTKAISPSTPEHN